MDNETDLYRTHVRRPHDKVEVLNVDEICFPESIKVENLDTLKPFFDAVILAVSEGLKVTVNAPEVNVTTTPVVVPAPEVTVTPTPVNIPKVDYSPLIKGFNESLRRIRENSSDNPLEVNINDLRLIEKLNELIESSKNIMLGFPGAVSIRGADGGIINPATAESVGAPTTILDNRKTVTTAGTRVQIVTASTPIRSAAFTALSTNTGTICLGGATVIASASTRTGVPLSAGDSAVIEINDLNKIWMDSTVNGEGVSYYYKN